MSRCVLVVEDEVLVNMFTSGEIRAAGYEVHTAFSADEAMRLLVVVLDQSRTGNCPESVRAGRAAVGITAPAALF
jgi:hypothetical protein